MMERKIQVETQMLIRKPISEVFEAFIDPEITTQFWFTRSSGKLEEGKHIVWEWEMYGVKDTVEVLRIVPDELITIRWSTPPHLVDFRFREVATGTYVEIFCYGFHQPCEELINVVKDLTGGFTTVLDGLKAWLEHGIALGLIYDKFPKEITSPR